MKEVGNWPERHEHEKSEGSDTFDQAHPSLLTRMEVLEEEARQMVAKGSFAETPLGWTWPEAKKKGTLSIMKKSLPSLPPAAQKVFPRLAFKQKPSVARRFVF